MSKSAVSTSIRSYLKRLFAEYNESISLPQPYNYFYGNPVQPVVPLDLAQDGVFIIGAYPTARFATMKGERDVPISDINCPFSNERYFDGSGVREIKSGKVFLFKPGHIDKYRRLDCDWPPEANRKKFEQYAHEGMAWLEQEIQLARPRLIITLGNEVAGVLQDVKGREKRNALLGGDLKDLIIAGRKYPVIHLAHPGIVMRKASSRNPWLKHHREIHIPEAHKSILALMA